MYKDVAFAQIQLEIYTLAAASLPYRYEKDPFFSLTTLGSSPMINGIGPFFFFFLLGEIQNRFPRGPFTWAVISLHSLSFLLLGLYRAFLCTCTKACPTGNFIFSVIPRVLLNSSVVARIASSD